MVRLQKLYSKFKAIESGRAVTEVTKGSYCSRTRIVGVSRRPLEHRSLCSTWSQAFFGWTSPSCASTQGERGSVGRGKLGMLIGGRWISCYSGTRGRRPAAPLPGQCTPGQQLRTGPSLPIVAGFSPLGGRFTASHGPGSSGCSLFFHLAMAGFYIDLLGNLIQGLISFFFFVESLLQEIGGFVFSQQIGISPHCAVASNLVVFYPLSSGNQSGVFYFSVDIIFFFKDLTALLTRPSMPLHFCVLAFWPIPSKICSIR